MLIKTKRFSPARITGLFWLGLVIQLFPLILLIMKTAPWTTADSGLYIELSKSLMDGRGFGHGDATSYEPEGLRAPGYPVLVAAGRFITGGNNIGIVLIQSALFLISVWLIYKVAVRTFGPMTGLIFLLFSTIYPFIAYSVGQISPEIPSVFLLSLAFFLLTDPTIWRVALAASLIGISAYIRPNLILLNFAFAAALVLMDRRFYRKALLVAAIAIIVALPWAARNYLAFGKFTPMPVAKGSGASLLLATWQSRVSIPTLVEYGMNGNINAEARFAGMADQIEDLNRRIGVPENTIFVSLQNYPGNRKKIKADELFAEAAISNIKKYPLAYLKSTLTNSIRMWFSAYFPENISTVIRYGLLTEGILLLIFGLAGAFVTVRDADEKQRWVLILFATTFLYFSLTLCWLHTEARYTIPARLLLLLFAAHFMDRLIRKLTRGVSTRTDQIRRADTMKIVEVTQGKS